MSPIYSTYTENGDELFIDLRRITHIVRLKSEMDSSYIRMDPADHDMLLPDHIADPLRDAWRAYNGGEHAPTPAVGVPGLPDGWRMAGDYTATDGDRTVRVDEDGYVWIFGGPYAPLAVIEFVARHRARAGGAA